MSVRKLILSSALVALMGFVATGCNENPSDPSIGDVTGLQASSMTATSVALRWNAVSGATSYEVKWAPTTVATANTGQVTVTSPSATATGLTAGVEYRFTVTPSDASGAGTGSSITWAGASRHNTTATTSHIRMYEFTSNLNSGLNLNVNGQPAPVRLSASATGQPIGQLAMYVYQRAGQSKPDSIIVGPVYAMTEYRVSAGNDFTRIDSSVYISSATTLVPSLNEWYLSAPLNTLIAANSNVMAYKFQPATAGGDIAGGHGFIVRTGTGSATNPYHYARVHIKSLGGMMLGGATGNRYVELEISYQDANNLPYAKPGQRPLPVGVQATLGH